MPGLISWRERNEIDRLRNDMDRVFHRFLDWTPFPGLSESGDWAPRVDVAETAEAVIVYAELPGMDVEDIHVTLDRRILTIRGQRKGREEPEEQNYHRTECQCGTFCRSIELPADVNPERIEAVYKKGILKMNLPKTMDQKARKIQIKS